MAFKVTLNDNYDVVVLPNGVVIHGGESATLVDKYFYQIKEDVAANLFSDVDYVGQMPGEGGMDPEEFVAEAPLSWDAEGTTLTISVGTGSGDVAAGDHGHVAEDISDSTTTGRNVLTASNQANARSAISAAATGHNHAIADVTNLEDTLNGKLTASQAAAVADVDNDVEATLNALLASLRSAGILDT